MSKPQQEIAAPTKILPQSKELKEKTIYFTTRRITYIATLTAVTLVLKILGNMLPTGSTRVSLVYLGWMLSGIILGPFGGMIVGLASDVLGWFVVPGGGGFNPIITLGNTLFPLFIALSYRLPIKDKSVALSIGTICSLIICTLGINSIGLYYMYGYSKTMSFFEYLITFRYMQPVIVGLNLVLFLCLVPVIKRIRLFDCL